MRSLINTCYTDHSHPWHELLMLTCPVCPVPQGFASCRGTVNSTSPCGLQEPCPHLSAAQTAQPSRLHPLRVPPPASAPPRPGGDTPAAGASHACVLPCTSEGPSSAAHAGSPAAHTLPAASVPCILRRISILSIMRTWQQVGSHHVLAPCAGVQDSTVQESGLATDHQAICGTLMRQGDRSSDAVRAQGKPGYIPTACSASQNKNCPAALHTQGEVLGSPPPSR